MYPKWCSTNRTSLLTPVTATALMAWHVMTSRTTLDLGSISQVFILVKDAGAGDADGVYKPASRRWLEHDVYENRFGECIISREAQTSKTGQVKHGSLPAKRKHPNYRMIVWTCLDMFCSLCFLVGYDELFLCIMSTSELQVLFPMLTALLPLENMWI